MLLKNPVKGNLRADGITVLAGFDQLLDLSKCRRLDEENVLLFTSGIEEGVLDGAEGF